MVLNQANKLIKSSRNEVTCEDFTVCQIKIKYLDFPSGRSCSGGICHDALISTGCVGWMDGNACQAYIDNDQDAIFYGNKSNCFLTNKINTIIQRENFTIIGKARKLNFTGRQRRIKNRLNLTAKMMLCRCCRIKCKTNFNMLARRYLKKKFRNSSLHFCPVQLQF